MGSAMRIAVVIPVRDDGAALERCLAALQRQLRTADELVVVDSGSMDDSAAIALRYGARLVHPEGAGIPAATAAGLDAAHGDLLARLDADTVAPADWLARIEAAFVADPECNGVAERFIRTLKEQLLWVEVFDDVDHLNEALHRFRLQYNASWLVQKHQHRTPDQVRSLLCQPAALAA